MRAFDRAVQGLDPNFHDEAGAGETPLTVAATIDAVDVLVALIEVSHAIYVADPYCHGMTGSAAVMLCASALRMLIYFICLDYNSVEIIRIFCRAGRIWTSDVATA